MNYMQRFLAEMLLFRFRLEETRNELQVTKKSASGDLAQTEDELLKLKKE